MTLETFWFIVITVLWTGFFVLEGFDLGVGMLHGVLGKDEAGRRAAINTIGPLWDGNEVWLIVAGAGMFAAFPGWYATMFSGFYVAMVLLLLALIARGVSFEFRSKQDSPRWRRTWDGLMTGGSVLVALLIGVALGNLLHGVPIGQNQEFTGSLVDLLNPYSLFVGVTLLLLCVLQGATFLSLKTTADLRQRSAKLARQTAPVAGLAVLIFAVWTHIVSGRGVIPNLFQFTAVIAVIASAWLLRERATGWSFAATSVAISSTILALFVDLYPRVMVSSTNPAYSLTIQNTASGTYALKVMTVVTVILFPTVLVYQGWTYHVFRARVSTDTFSGSGKPVPAPRTAPGGAGSMRSAQPDTELAAGPRDRRLLRRGAPASRYLAVATAIAAGLAALVVLSRTGMRPHRWAAARVKSQLRRDLRTPPVGVVGQAPAPLSD
ncbi:MAG: cytochrome d ubiquinol oxidase subunit II [Dermatophilaceae bacterium]